MPFKYALGGKLIRARVAFAAQASQEVVITGPGVGGSFKANEYSIVGLPTVQAIDTFTVVTARNTQTYTLVIKNRTFTITSDGTATTTEIRDAILALLTAPVQASLGITAVSQAANQILITALTPGDPLDTSATAQTPADVTLANSLNTATGNTGITAKRNGRFTIRSTAAITATFDIVVVA